MGLNFAYQPGVSKQATYARQNFDVNCYKVGAFPVWEVSNDDKDNTWKGADNMPASASVILRSQSTSPTPLTVRTIATRVATSWRRAPWRPSSTGPTPR